MLIHEVLLESEQTAVKTFLKRFKLQYEADIDESIVIEEDDRIIATGSIAKNIIKCIAIDPDYQGRNLLGTLMTDLIKRLYNKNITHYFVYTLDEQAHLFKFLGLKTIVQTMTLTLLEGGGDITTALKQLKDDYAVSNKPKACVVVNANPMTKGHLHLIETVAKNHEEVLVFVVSEDRSLFPFNMRFAIVKKACEPYPNVTVLPTLDYLVSYATFPKYFLKHETVIKEEHALIDVLIFKQYYMKIFNISTRYVGEEPLSEMTEIYNNTMRKYLNHNFRIIERLAIKDCPISASTVRKLLKKNGLETVKLYVPDATYSMLESKEGRDIIEKLKTYDKRH